MRASDCNYIHFFVLFEYFPECFIVLQKKFECFFIATMLRQLENLFDSFLLPLRLVFEYVDISITHNA